MTPFGLTPEDWHIVITLAGILAFCLVVMWIAGRIADDE